MLVIIEPTCPGLLKLAELYYFGQLPIKKRFTARQIEIKTP
jgi:hypothetical protein